MEKLSPELLVDVFNALETTRACPGECVPEFINRVLSKFEPASLRPRLTKAVVRVAEVVEVLHDDASHEHVEGVWRLLQHPTNIEVLEKAIAHTCGN
ncbi:MAG: hypothetical protein FHP94_03125 [Denitromonas halophila]|nr:MAG: hypothetical protein FHP94_03125 [Denitromonas halophila]TVT72848.1 MAG: hypothetical protein FHP93_07625 [Denitromonas halophila]